MALPIPAFTSATALSLRRPRPGALCPMRPALPCPSRTHSARPPVPHMTAAAHELRRRIASVGAAEKIVSALRLVAAARIRASSRAALRTRPFAEELQHVLASLVHVIVRRNIDIEAVAQGTPPSSLASLHGAVLAEPIVQKALLDKIYLALLHKPADIAAETRRWRNGEPVTILAVLAADKGFCGPYNKDILAKAARRIRELESVDKIVELVVVGRSAQLYFARHFAHIPVRSYLPMGKSTDAEQTATMLSHILLSEFIAGGVDRLEIIYTRFVSLISNAPSARTLLPLTPTGLEAVGDELFQFTLTTKNGRLATKKSPLPSFDGLPETSHASREKFYNISDDEAVQLLNSMLPLYVTSQLIRIVREVIASEQASRLAAMTAATDNAREIVTSLQSRYNKERQARITNEIIEVTTNANA